METIDPLRGISIAHPVIVADQRSESSSPRQAKHALVPKESELADRLERLHQTDEEGANQLKFELQDATKGQANVEQFLSTSNEPVTVSVDPSKVSADILGDLACFCIAIAGTAPLAPERAKLHVVSAKSR